MVPRATACGPISSDSNGQVLLWTRLNHLRPALGWEPKHLQRALGGFTSILRLSCSTVKSSREGATSKVILSPR